MNFLTCENFFLRQTSILIGNPQAGPNTVVVTLPQGQKVPTLVWKTTQYGPGESFTITMNEHEFINIRQQNGSGN
jgi:hypothetical protein